MNQFFPNWINLVLHKDEIAYWQKEKLKIKKKSQIWTTFYFSKVFQRLEVWNERGTNCELINLFIYLYIAPKNLYLVYFIKKSSKVIEIFEYTDLFVTLKGLEYNIWWWLSKNFLLSIEVYIIYLKNSGLLRKVIFFEKLVIKN